MHFSLDDSTFSSVREPRLVTAKRQMDSREFRETPARFTRASSAPQSAARMRDLLPEFLEDVARDDASARATEAAGGAGEAPRGFLARAWPLGKSGSRRGREPKKAPRDDLLSARFLAEASAVTAAIEAWRRDLADLRRAHAAAADAASTRALAETRRALLEKTTAASETAACLASTVDALERGGETFSFSDVPFSSDAAEASAERPPDLRGKKVSDTNAVMMTHHHPTPHHERLVRTVAAGVRAKFAAAARAFGDIKADARRRREEALKTRHFLRHATVPNLDAARRAAEAEAEDILDDRDVDDREEPRVSGDSGRTAGTAGPSRLLFSVSETFDPNESARRSERFLAFDDVERSCAPRTLHDETRRQSRQSLEAEKQRLELAVELERGAHQLHAAFVDMATLADGQGERVDSVEAHVATAAVAATRGAEMLKRAREYQKQRNKRLRCVGSIACVVALVAIAVVVAGFGAVV